MKRRWLYLIIRAGLFKWLERFRTSLSARERKRKWFCWKTLTLSIIESKDLHDALVVTLEKVCSATGWIYGEAWIPDPEGKCLVRDHAFYSKAESLGKFSELSGAFTFTHGVGLPGRAWSMKKPVWVPDVTVDPDYPRAEIAREAGLRAGVAFPVFSDDEIVADLVFFMFKVLERGDRLVRFVLSG